MTEGRLEKIVLHVLACLDISFRNMDTQIEKMLIVINFHVADYFAYIYIYTELKCFYYIKGHKVHYLAVHMILHLYI